MISLWRSKPSTKRATSRITTSNPTTPLAAVGPAPAGRGPAFCLQPAFVAAGEIDEGHRIRDGPMPGLLCDQPVHLLAHATVHRVSLRGGPELDDVHGFPRV